MIKVHTERVHAIVHFHPIMPEKMQLKGTGSPDRFQIILSKFTYLGFSKNRGWLSNF